MEMNILRSSLATHLHCSVQHRGAGLHSCSLIMKLGDNKMSKNHSYVVQLKKT